MGLAGMGLMQDLSEICPLSKRRWHMEDLQSAYDLGVKHGAHTVYGPFVPPDIPTVGTGLCNRIVIAMQDTSLWLLGILIHWAHAGMKESRA